MGLVFLEQDCTEEPENACRPLTICDADMNDIANIYSADDSTVSVTRGQAIAYAHLFANSPDLLESLRELIGVCQSHIGQLNTHEIESLEIARSIAAQAEGRAS